MRLLPAFLLALACAHPAQAQSVPQYVKGPLSGFEYECQQEKQTFSAREFVTRFDLDGDGKPDHIFDVSKGCAASKLLYCNEAEGCLIDVFLSSQELKMAGLKVRSFKTGKHKDRPALLLELGGGKECGGKATCQKAMVWNGTDLVIE